SDVHAVVVPGNGAAGDRPRAATDEHAIGAAPGSDRAAGDVQGAAPDTDARAAPGNRAAGNVDCAALDQDDRHLGTGGDHGTVLNIEPAIGGHRDRPGERAINDVRARR